MERPVELFDPVMLRVHHPEVVTAIRYVSASILLVIFLGIALSAIGTESDHR